MPPIESPTAGPGDPLFFRNADEVAAWLARQPLAEPVQMQAVLQKAVAAVDASAIPPAARLAILDGLRRAVVVTQFGLEPRYTRKPLPLPAGDAELFFAARKLWRTLAVAYLRIVPLLPAAEAVAPLHRGAVALRAEHYAHLLAGYEVPGKLLQLLHGILATAERLGVQYTPLDDRDYKHVGESHISGQVAWAFLLQFIDPYRLSLAQLLVANRALSRWRELVAFRMQPDASPRARDLPLMDLLGKDGLAEGGPRWLDVRPVARKIRKRIEALEGGAAPEALNLGRELSATACIRLLVQLDEALRPGPATENRDAGNVDLVFGAENIYALLAGKPFGPAPDEPQARIVDHRRVALFGFDNLAAQATAQRHPVSGEAWQIVDGYALRSLEDGKRLLPPCLVARESEPGQAARLGVLNGLRVSSDGKLKATLQWYTPPVQADSAQLGSGSGAPVRAPVFVIATDQGLSLALPAGMGVRPAGRLVLEGSGLAPLVLGQVLERGSDFVRYAVAHP